MTDGAEHPRYINRELSWLQFNQRVLDQATAQDHALLEQAKFLAISSSNLDEFFMVRVGSLKLAADRHSEKVDLTGQTAADQLNAIKPVISELVQQQYQVFSQHLEPSLAAHGIRRLTRSELAADMTAALDPFFQDVVASGLAPIAIGHPNEFPVLRGTRMGLFVRLKAGTGGDLRQVGQKARLPEQSEAQRYVLIPFAFTPHLHRVVQLPSSQGIRYALLEDVLAVRFGELMPAEQIEEAIPIRITRNADFELDEYSDDFMLEVLELIGQRQASQCVRLELAADASETMVEFLKSALGVEDDSVYKVGGPVDLTYLSSIVPPPRFSELRDAPWPPLPSPDFPSGSDIFETIRQSDRLLVHPYQQFDPVLDLLRAAAVDPQVLAIKQTLYRTARESKIVEALLEAKSYGKHVTVVVELKARFDEQRNVQWARRLERAGVDVIYGVSELKTHAKLCVVVRRDDDGIRRYVHLGTGNYNESTAALYSDISLFTCDDQMGQDVVHAFNAITGMSTPMTLKKLSMAPLDLRETLLMLIRTEAINAQKGGRAAIDVKLNSLVDQTVIDELYAASQAGVTIRLNIRGVCCLRPGIAGLSERIRVVSVVDRFLEHARILQFHHGGEERVYISSADWMGRNLDRRVELLIPVEEPELRRRLQHAMEAYFADNTHGYDLQADGRYVKMPRRRRKAVRAQRLLYEECERLNRQHTNPHGAVFRPLRGADG